MSTWTAPATFASTTLTAATMNTEVRDHLTFLKGFADLITNSTTADTGTATYLAINRGTSTSPVLSAAVSGDSVVRFSMDAAGKMTWGSGSAATDVNLYRSAVNVLRTDTAFGAANIQVLSGVIDITESAAAPSGISNNARIYAIDDGAGKTSLRVVFGSGAAQTITTEP